MSKESHFPLQWILVMAHRKVDFQTFAVRGQVNFNHWVEEFSDFKLSLLHNCTNEKSYFYLDSCCHMWPWLRKGAQMKKNQILKFWPLWKFYGNISSSFPDMAILYISLTINFVFVFNWFFIRFLGLQQWSIPHSDLQLSYCLT